MSDVVSLIIWFFGDTPELCLEFSIATGNRSSSSMADFAADTPPEFFRYYGIGNYWRGENDHSVIGAAQGLERALMFWDDTMWSSEVLTSVLQGAIVLIDLNRVESVKHAIDTLKFLYDFPQIIAVRQSDQRKSWHSKINILNDPNTLTYHPNDKDSIKHVWQMMIRRFELDAELERRFLDCIDSKV